MDPRIELLTLLNAERPEWVEAHCHTQRIGAVPFVSHMGIDVGLINLRFNVLWASGGFNTLEFNFPLGTTVKQITDQIDPYYEKFQVAKVEAALRMGTVP